MQDLYIQTLMVLGFLLLFVTLGSGWLARLPLNYALIYLGVGILLGPYGVNWIQLRLNAHFLEHFTEFVVLVSLFSTGMKMNRPLTLRCWQSTIRLIGLLMPISILAIAAVGHWFIHLPWGTAVLLGAILAPTDPVLASEIQLAHEEDPDELRFGLTSESGLNDALAFPFVYFGLRWIENPGWQTWVGNWIAIDVFWAVFAGFAMGIVVPTGIIWIEKTIQRYRRVDESMSNFVAISAILLTYSLTELVNGYGFLAVFIAGIVFRRDKRPEDRVPQQEFTDEFERLLEVAIIVLLGSMLRVEPFLIYLGPVTLLAGLLFFIIRPVGAWISTIGLYKRKQREYLPGTTRLLFGWFGIRGVGSLYYMTYALSHGIPEAQGEEIAWLTMITVSASVIIHGISATPLMKWYERNVRKWSPIQEYSSSRS